MTRQVVTFYTLVTFQGDDCPVAVTDRSPRRRRPGAPRLVSSAVLLLGLAAPLAACSGGEPEALSTPSSAVLVPGRPGETPQTIAPEDYAGIERDDGWTEADSTFMTMMIEHHGQAVEMTNLAPERARSEQVRRFAERISVVQDGEIRYMTTWLEERNLPVPGKADAAGDGSGPRAPEGHDHGTMPGMLTDDEMTALREADGAEFDRLFLESMIKHHRGALEMCDDAMAGGKDVVVQELAASVAADQTAEISRMDQLLAAM